MTTTRFIPSPIVIPATGPATAGGHVLDEGTVLVNERLGAYESILDMAIRARRDGFVLCLRPTADRPACIDLGAHHFADASLSADFDDRAMIVDPYDEDGEDIRDRAPVVKAVQVAA